MIRSPIAVAACIAVATVGLGAAGPASAVSVNRCFTKDNGDPILDSLTMSTSSVDVTTSSKTVVFTAAAHDTGGPGAPVGVRAGEVILQSPWDSYLVAHLHLAGSAFVGSVTVKRGVDPGPWTVLGFSLSDTVGNHNYYDYNELGSIGADRDLAVTSVRDTTPGTLTGFSLARSAVDTTNRPARLTITAHASDAESGVAFVDVSAHKVHGHGRVYARLEPAGGDRFKGQLRVPAWAGTGRWRVSRVEVWDAVNNFKLYGHRALAGYPRSFHVTSGRDRTAPSIVSFAEHGTVDTRHKADHLKVTVQTKDAVSGLASVQVIAIGPGVRRVAATLHRSAGTSHKGTWTGRLRFSFCRAVAGRWQLGVSVTDRAGHRTYAVAGHLRVRARDHLPPELDPHDVGPADQPIRIRFDEAVVGVSTRNIAVEEYDPFGNAPELAGTWACFNHSGASTSCTTGRVRSAAFTPVDPLISNGSYDLILGKEHHLGLMDLAGNPFHRFHWPYLTT